MIENAIDKRGAHWRQMIEALWTFTYLTTAFRGLLPRLRRLPRELRRLEHLSADLDDRAVQILRHELVECTAQFEEIVQLINAQYSGMRDLLEALRSAHEVRDGRE